MFNNLFLVAVLVDISSKPIFYFILHFYRLIKTF